MKSDAQEPEDHLTIWMRLLLPDAIGSLGKLKYLDVWANKIASLPATIGSLRELNHLNALRNRLTSLPSAILRFLILQGNDISELNEGANLGKAKSNIRGQRHV